MKKRTEIFPLADVIKIYLFSNLMHVRLVSLFSFLKLVFHLELLFLPVSGQSLTCSEHPLVKIPLFSYFSKITGLLKGL